MPIYEYYCPDNHTVYQFYAKTLAQGRTVPKCPDNPRYRMKKMLSAFAVSSGGKKDSDLPPPATAAGSASDAMEDARMTAALSSMEKEFSSVDENDPRAMGRMMRRMAELSGEKIDGQMEEVVRKLEEGADPDALEEQLGGEAPCNMEDPDGGGAGASQPEPKEKKARPMTRRRAPTRDPKLYDYE